MGLASKLASKLSKADIQKNFNKKFKDTVVTDENKNPAVMYHGRIQDYDKFETVNTGNRGEIGTHFGPANQANVFAKGEGANVVPVYLDIKKPLRLQDRGTFNTDEVLEQLRFQGFDNATIDKIENLPVKEQNKATIDLIKSKGYDGIVYLNRTDGFTFKGSPEQIENQKELLEAGSDSFVREKFGAKDSYIIFDPTQAKSPFNKGDYSETDPRFNFNKGGSTLSGGSVKNIKQTKKLFEEGGMLDEGGTIDPESGNEVPTGSLQKEVRDDIPARLSEGEFVFPADVVRFIGLEKLMQMRQAAKEGLSKMEAMGQMGNSEEAEIDDDVDFESFIDEALKEDDASEELEFQQGGMAPAVPPVYQPYNPQAATSYTPPNMQQYLASARQTAGPNKYADTLKMLERRGAINVSPEASGGFSDVGQTSGTASGPTGSHGGITAPATGVGRGVGTMMANVVGLPAPVGVAVGKSIANQAAVATNQAAVANNLSVANFSQEAINAAIDAAVNATTESNATPGAVAAAAANAASAVDNTDPMDAMMSVTNNFSDVAVDAPVSEAEAVSTEAATSDVADTADTAAADSSADAGDAGDAGSSDGGGGDADAGAGDGSSGDGSSGDGSSGDGGDGGDGDGGDGGDGFQVGGFVNKKKKVYNKKKSRTSKGLAAKKT